MQPLSSLPFDLHGGNPSRQGRANNAKHGVQTYVCNPYPPLPRHPTAFIAETHQRKFILHHRLQTYVYNPYHLFPSTFMAETHEGKARQGNNANYTSRCKLTCATPIPPSRLPTVFRGVNPPRQGKAVIHTAPQGATLCVQPLSPCLFHLYDRNPPRQGTAYNATTGCNLMCATPIPSPRPPTVFMAKTH